MLELLKPPKTKNSKQKTKYKVKKMIRFILKPFKCHLSFKKRIKIYLRSQKTNKRKQLTSTLIRNPSKRMQFR